jgi:hypothetical protein
MPIILFPLAAIGASVIMPYIIKAGEASRVYQNKPTYENGGILFKPSQATATPVKLNGRRERLAQRAINEAERKALRAKRQASLLAKKERDFLLENEGEEPASPVVSITPPTDSEDEPEHASATVLAKLDHEEEQRRDSGYESDFSATEDERLREVPRIRIPILVKKNKGPAFDGSMFLQVPMRSDLIVV